MPLQTEIETAVAAVLNQHAAEAERIKNDAVRVAIAETKRLEAEATRESALKLKAEIETLAALETQHDNVTAAIRAAVAQYKSLPDAICALERDFSVLMQQIHTQRCRMGLKG